MESLDMDAAPFDFLMQTSHHGSRLANEEETLNAHGAPRCQRCEVLPEPIVGPGTLHLRFPLTHSMGKILAYLKSSHRIYKAEGGVISIEVPEADLSHALLPLMATLMTAEQRDARAIFQPRGHLMQLADYFEMSTLQALTARVQSNWLMEMLRDQRLNIVFQPIVHLRPDDHIHAYECLMRGIVNGQTVSPSLIMDVARGAELMFQLDLAARRAAICAASSHKIQQKIFINFGPTAIYDPVNCLRSTVALVDMQHLRRDQLVFEVIETDHMPDTGHLKNIVCYYRDNGFGVALDDLGAGHSSLNMLNKLRPDYVKLDMDLTRDVHKDPYKALIARKLLETASELGLKSVAEGVETREEYEWVEAHGADFVQGYYLAKPASPPPLTQRLA